jgi:hypothetical protein
LPAARNGLLGLAQTVQGGRDVDLRYV